MDVSIIVNDARFMCRMSEESSMETVSERPAFVDSSIPIEIVDDDELAAIEAAFLQASSVHCSLPRSKSYAPSSIRAPPLQRNRSLAESANYWLTQCLNVKGRVNSRDRGTCSVSILEVHSSNCSSSTEISLPSNALKVKSQSYNSSCCEDSVSIKCCSSREKETLVSLQSTLDESNPKGDEVSTVHKDLAIPIVQDIEDLPSDKDAAKTPTEDVPPEPKPRCLSVTDFTAFVSSHVISCLFLIISDVAY